MPLPVADHGNVRSHVFHCPFSTSNLLILPARSDRCIRSIVARKQNDCIFGLPDFFNFLNNPTYNFIHVVDHRDKVFFALGFAFRCFVG